VNEKRPGPEGWYHDAQAPLLFLRCSSNPKLGTKVDKPLPAKSLKSTIARLLPQPFPLLAPINTTTFALSVSLVASSSPAYTCISSHQSPLRTSLTSVTTAEMVAKAINLGLRVSEVCPSSQSLTPFHWKSSALFAVEFRPCGRFPTIGILRQRRPSSDLRRTVANKNVDL